MKTSQLVAIIVLGFLISLGLLFLQYQKLRYQAIDNCLQYAGTYEYTSSTSGEKSSLPQKEVYKACLLDKGLTSSWK